MSLQLHEVLKNGYSKHKKTNINGFKLDKDLSNGNNQVYFNKTNGKLIYNVNGTRNLRDWGTDFISAFGGLKSTNRYKDADKKLQQAKKKYNTNAIITGHSLGGGISSLISKKDDKVYTLNKYGLGNKIKENEEGLRTSGDVVSLLNLNSKHMKTIKSNHSINPIKAHDVDNIKNQNINII